MRVRQYGYCDYGFAPGEETQLLAFCRGSDFAEEFLLLECAKKSNPAICADIYYSLVRGLSWEQLDKRTTQFYGKVDFYAYRRRTLGLFRAALIECGRYPVKGIGAAGKRQKGQTQYEIERQKGYGDHGRKEPDSGNSVQQDGTF